MEDSTQVHNEADVEKTSTWKKIQNTIMMIAALMISAGQWSDTKEVVKSSYESIVENFTHSLQYELLRKVHIGNSMDYVKLLVGEPNVIKRSKINPDVRFQYYNEGKFNLTLISSDSRLVGYSVFTQEDGFSPTIPFSEDLGTQSINTAHNKQGVYSFDIGNLVYYIESQDLGKQQMFLTLMRGYVEYGKSPTSKRSGLDYKEKVNTLIENLDQQATFSENDDELSTILNNLRKVIYPNFYAVTELEPSIISEALLTRYEYQILTKS